MRILVVGAGAIGGLLAAKLALAGPGTVQLGVRRPTPGLTLEDAEGSRSAPVEIIESPSQAHVADWVLIVTKTYDTAGVGPWLDVAADDSTRVVVVQNGIEHVDRLRALFDAERTVPAVTMHGAERLAPGVVRHVNVGSVVLPNSPHGRAFASLTEPAGIGTEVATNFDEVLWTKLAYNVVGNSITTLTGLPVNCIATRPPLADLAAALFQECVDTAAARGVDLPTNFVTDAVRHLGTYADSVRSSMWFDLQAGRRLEHDAISGSVVRAADHSGVDVPRTRTLTTLLDALSPGT